MHAVRVLENKKDFAPDSLISAAYDSYLTWFTKPIPPKNVTLNLPMSYLLRDFWQYPSDIVPN